VGSRAVGNAADIEIVVVSDSGVTDQDGLLGWALRDFKQVAYVTAAEFATGAPVVITGDTLPDPALGTAYVGEKFVIQNRSAEWPAVLLSPEMLKATINWWLYRTGPTEAARAVVVWVRADIHALTRQR
jgi:hypothetical protein